MYQVALDPTAVMGRRIGGWVLDFVFAGILAVIATNVFVDGYTEIPGNLCREETTSDESTVCNTEFLGRDGFAIYDEATDESSFFESDGLWAPLAIWVGYGFLSFVLIEGLVGGSLGKLIVGLRVVKGDGTKAGPGRTLMRFLMWVVDAIPYCFPLVGLITGMTTKGHRRVGDMVAGTFVVGTRDVGHPVSIPGLTPPAPYVPGPGAPGADVLAGTPYAATLTPTPYEPAPSGAIVDAPTAPSSEPQWDPQRNTHIQWDAARNCWLQWDNAAQEWRPIE